MSLIDITCGRGKYYNSREILKQVYCAPYIIKATQPDTDLLFPVPTDPPTIRSISTTATSIHVKWSPPFFINMPLIVYKLTVTKLPGGESRVKEVEARGNEPMSEVMTLLDANTRYRMSVVAVNRDGAGPVAEKEVTTQTESIGKASTVLEV